MVNAPNDWDPRSEAVLANQIAGYDAMRQRCPMAHSEYLHWSLFRHADVMRVLNDPLTFGNAASSNLSVPNGMDPPQHTRYRRIVDAYFTPQRMHAPLIASRRVTTRPTEIAGRALPCGARISLMWASANRDEAVFADPDELRLDRDPANTLLSTLALRIETPARQAA